MNLETSCWGRAIGSLGIGTDRAVATMQEVAFAKARQVTRSTGPIEDDPFATVPPPVEAVEAARDSMGHHRTPSGRTRSNGDGLATEKQRQALDKMAGHLGYADLGELLAADSEPMLGRVATLDDLTKAEASVVFDAVKAYREARP
jgi:hypothetical protein